ncbi:MAG: hypothetical protein NUW37_19695 [Planctomycetes bacterium]|nr:hypothetical protein [Planctomycetota bacterium]
MKNSIILLYVFTAGSLVVSCKSALPDKNVNSDCYMEISAETIETTQERPASDTFNDRLDWLCRLECRYFLPNTMATLLSPEEKRLELEVIRSKILLETLSLAKTISQEDRAIIENKLNSDLVCPESSRLTLLRLLRASGSSIDDCRKHLPDSCFSCQISQAGSCSESGILHSGYDEMICKSVREGKFLFDNGAASLMMSN